MKTAILSCLGFLVLGLAAFAFDAGAGDEPIAAPTAPAGASVDTTDLAATAGASATEARRAPGPPRIALQAGHWKAAEAPDEQAGLRGNGTRGGGKQEWEVNLAIATKTAALLEEAGYAVDILPTTIPPGYRADLFIAIHADGSPDPSTSGFRAAAPRRDRTGRAADFARLLETTYGEATGLRHYPVVTRRMRYYYAFNSRRYDHALDPSTVGVIIETGFLTSPADRRIIVDGQDRVASGIADAVKLYVATMDLEPRLASTADRPAAE